MWNKIGSGQLRHKNSKLTQSIPNELCQAIQGRFGKNVNKFTVIETSSVTMGEGGTYFHYSDKQIDSESIDCESSFHAGSAIELIGKKVDTMSGDWVAEVNYSYATSGTPYYVMIYKIQ